MGASLDSEWMICNNILSELDFFSLSHFSFVLHFIGKITLHFYPSADSRHMYIKMGFD